jgi:ADP-ribose pyrophosphatase YjhB (NUDIX family)
MLLLIERWRLDSRGRSLHYYSIPGGGIDSGETPEQAVVREMHEEMLIDVKPIRLLARQKAVRRKNVHHYFLCQRISGTPIFNMDSEEGRFRAFHGNRYEVAWVVLEEVAEKIHHDEYRQLIELLPELLADPDLPAVDIVSEG